MSFLGKLEIGMSFGTVMSKENEALDEANKKANPKRNSRSFGSGHYIGSIYNQYEGGRRYVADYAEGGESAFITFGNGERTYTNAYKPQVPNYNRYAENGYSLKLTYIENNYYDEQGNYKTEWAIDKNGNGFIDEGEITDQKPNL